MTGFNTKTRALVIDRDNFTCQWCGRRATTYSLQHRRARQGKIGRERAKVTNGPANAVFMCGTGTTGCHGWVESHPAAALGRGFRVSQYDDPARVPLVDWAGREWWLTADGRRVLTGVTTDDPLRGCPF